MIYKGEIVLSCQMQSIHMEIHALCGSEVESDFDMLHFVGARSRTRYII